MRRARNPRNVGKFFTKDLARAFAVAGSVTAINDDVCDATWHIFLDGALDKTGNVFTRLRLIYFD